MDISIAVSIRRERTPLPHPGSLLLLLLTGVLAACGSEKPPAPPAKPAAALTDGCYYGDGKPVLKIEGKRGTLLVPGDVKTFRVEAGGNQHQRLALFTPGFLFDGGGVYKAPGATTEPTPSPIIAEKFGSETRSYDMLPGPVPTIRMQWAAYGEWDLVRGAPC